MADYTTHKPKFTLTVGADGTEESHTGNALTKIKEMTFIKGTFNAKQLKVEIELKTDNATTPAFCRVRHDGLAGNDLSLETSSLTYVILDGIIDISGFAAGRHTIEFHLEDGAGETVTLRETWVYGQE